MNARRGFTLLESIVALAIVSIVSVGVLAAEGSALRTEATANARLPLAMLAEERVTAVDLFGGSLARLPDSLVAGSFLPPFERASYTTRAERVRGTRSLWQLTVTVHQDADSFSLRTRRVRPDTGTAR